ncbi:unnamed protein product [Paramecium sonneborni]|uniref:Uncharacterized protein n=1 Tax=Paramecium sonneborni TaxID=65129 RepID=A0A8S1LQJ2_9CILI|nr:unnamed protein product [Paramecium sonneborni]
MCKQLLQALSQYIESNYRVDKRERLQSTFTICLQNVSNKITSILINIQGKIQAYCF